jgi:hypothetical protein
MTASRSPPRQDEGAATRGPFVVSRRFSTRLVPLRRAGIGRRRQGREPLRGALLVDLSLPLLFLLPLLVQFPTALLEVVVGSLRQVMSLRVRFTVEVPAQGIIRRAAGSRLR